MNKHVLRKLKRSYTPQHDPNKLRCDRCGGWTTTTTAVKGKWRSGWMRINHSTTEYVVDSQGDVDEVTEIDQRTIPRDITGWLCTGCQRCIDTFVDNNGVRHAVVRLLTTKTASITIIPPVEIIRPTHASLIKFRKR